MSERELLEAIKAKFCSQVSELLSLTDFIDEGLETGKFETQEWSDDFETRLEMMLMSAETWAQDNGSTVRIIIEDGRNEQ